MVGGYGGADVLSCCGGALADILRLRQEHVGVEAMNAGALGCLYGAPCVDESVSRVVGAIVVDRIDDVRVKVLIERGDSVGLPSGEVVDFLATYHYQLLVVNISVLDRAEVKGA